MSEPSDAPSTSSPLQFDRAELPSSGSPEAQEVACAFCRAPLYSYYFDLNGQMACEACRYKVEEEFKTRPGLSGFLRAAAAGFGAAVVGAGIYYAVLAITGYNVGLISILVGFLVGGAVRWGVRGKGGWVYQSLAIFLTYMAIVSTYIPLMVKEMDKQGTAGTETAAVAPDAPVAPEAPVATAGAPAPVKAAAQTPAEPAASEPVPTFGEMVLGVLLVFGVAAALPFLAGFENILGLLIIAFGLWEAWKLNKRPALEIQGPLTLGAAPTAPAPES
jgi:hypothetical protein